jgi:superoxide dismutase
MTLHHKKHHQTYVNGLNAAEEAYAKPLSVAEKVALQPAMKFNGGGMSYSFAIINQAFSHRESTQVISTTPCSGRISLPQTLVAVNLKMVP